MIPNKTPLLLSAILISALSQASQDPIDVVTREEFNALQEKVGSLESSIDALTESVNALTAGLTANDQRVTELDERMQRDYVSHRAKRFMVEGDSNTFYPVLFSLVPNREMNKIHISHYVHDAPSGWDGKMRFVIDVASYSWGGLPGYIQPEIYHYSREHDYQGEPPYIANFRYGGWGHFLVIWMLGGVQYNYQATNQSEIIVLKERTNLTSLFFPSHAEKYPDWVEPIKDIDAHMVPNGFRRWDPSTYGSYQASVAQPQQAAASIFPLINK